jgi:hypothetical protein
VAITGGSLRFASLTHRSLVRFTRSCAPITSAAVASRQGEHLQAIAGQHFKRFGRARQLLISDRVSVLQPVRFSPNWRELFAAPDVHL